MCGRRRLWDSWSWPCGGDGPVTASANLNAADLVEKRLQWLEGA